MWEQVGQVSRERFEQLVAQAGELVEQVTRSQLELGDMALEIEPIQAPDDARPASGVEVFTLVSVIAMFAYKSLQKSGRGISLVWVGCCVSSRCG
ncbi:hypothetical protein GCM10023205_79500 [Yinghuangia aomiensis]|uniref:Uncharacterized protein n=1 Tax=Yinghuangia aomiensis TaxID=676205 RepID=A0ABP9ICQ9_9ACTN